MDSEFAGEGIDDITVEAGGSGGNELIDCLMIRWVVSVISSACRGEMWGIRVESGECFAR